MLTKRESQVLEAIANYIEVNGFSPTVRELGEIIGLKSSSNVHKYLVELECKGFVTKIGNSPRTLKVLKTYEKN